MTKERLELDDIIALMRRVVVCLMHLHERGIIHGDIKPMNIVRRTPRSYPTAVALIHPQPPIHAPMCMHFAHAFSHPHTYPSRHLCISPTTHAPASTPTCTSTSNPAQSMGTFTLLTLTLTLTIRMPDGTYMLIDLDAAARIGIERAGVKYSSAFRCPSPTAFAVAFAPLSLHSSALFLTHYLQCAGTCSALVHARAPRGC